MNKTSKSPIILVLLLLLLLLGVYLYIHFNIYTAYKYATYNDFKHFYLGAKLLIHRINPYDGKIFHEYKTYEGFTSINPFVCLPFTGLILSPLTLFSFKTAYLIWFILNHIFLAVSFYLIFKTLNLKLNLLNITIAIWLAGYSGVVFRTLTSGQVNIFLLFLISLIWYLYIRKWKRLCGFFIAFAALFKLFPFILILYFALKKRWKIVTHSLLWIVILMIISVAIVGVRIHLDFIPVLESMRYGKSTFAEYGATFYVDQANQSINALLNRLFAQNPHTTPLIDLGETANYLTYFFSGILLLFSIQIILKRTLQDKAPDELEYSSFILLGLLIPSLCWDHYLVIIYFPVFAVVKYISELENPILKIFVSIPLFISVILMNLFFNFWNPLFTKGIWIFLMSIKLYGLLLLFFLVLTLMLTKSIKYNHFD